jgi:hypothetical protein
MSFGDSILFVVRVGESKLFSYICINKKTMDSLVPIIFFSIFIIAGIAQGIVHKRRMRNGEEGPWGPK